MRGVPLSWAVVLLAGCGTTVGKGNSPGELDSIDLAASPGWPDAIAVRSVPASFRGLPLAASGCEPDGRRIASRP